MATTVTIDAHTVNEVKLITGARTKTEAVRIALREFIRAQRRGELLELAGKIPLELSNEQLEKLEEQEGIL